MSIKSPYNFVPAPTESEVFKPDWADKVSHDVPFSDGESGEIELKITAMSPLFIRNGHKKDDKTNDFSHYIDENGEKRYFIPGSSLKGMFRNVLEIMSFSRMSQVDSDKIFALRDMNNKKFSNDEIRNTKTGWLTKKDGRWVIFNCKSDRVNMSSIASHFNIAGFNDLPAKEKYESCGISGFNNMLNFEYVCDIPMTGKIYNIVDNQSDLSGCLVMFGSMQNKKYEYVFQKPNLKGAHFELYSQDLYERILDIENDLDQSLWKYLKDLKTNSIPVFYKLDSQGKKVIHFGFSKIYKLNNTHYLKELEPLKSYFLEEKQRQKDDLKYDLAQLIFGHTSDGDALKGRVMVGHAISKNANPQANHEERVLGSPKPSFYPAYLKQSENIDQKKVYYNTYLNGDAELKGFKKYPINIAIKPNFNTDNENIASEFTPIQSGAIFCGKIRYQNLRKVELGALLSAITFHNCPNSFHNIGSAKPYGFGKIKLEIVNTNANISDALAYFEYQMDLHTNSTHKSNWLQTKNIKELLALSQTATGIADELLVYPKLENENERNNQRKNQFNNVKKDNLSLKDFSEINGVPNLKSLLSDDFVKKIEEEKRLSEQKVKDAILQKQQEEQAEKQRIIDEAKKLEEDRIAEQKRLEAERIARLQEEEKQRLIKREQYIEDGLSFLNDIETFDKAGRRINDWLKKSENTILPENQLPILKERMEYWSLKAKLKPRNWKQFQHFCNNTLPNWVGEELAIKWTEEFLK